MMDINESLNEEVDVRIPEVLTAKNITRIGYWNVRTLFQASKLSQVIKEMNSYKISILGLSEVRWTNSGKFISEGKTILFSGRDEELHRDGVALLLDKSAST